MEISVGFFNKNNCLYSNAKWSAPNAKWAAPNTKWSAPNAKWSAPNAKWSAPNVKWSAPNAKWSAPKYFFKEYFPYLAPNTAQYSSLFLICVSHLY